MKVWKPTQPEEDNLCTALSLLLYGNCSLHDGDDDEMAPAENNQRELDYCYPSSSSRISELSEEERNSWMIDEDLLTRRQTRPITTTPPMGLFLRSFQPTTASALSSSLSSSPLPTFEDSNARKNLFLNPLIVPIHSSLPIPSNCKDTTPETSSPLRRANTPETSAIFIRSDFSDDWIIPSSD